MSQKFSWGSPSHQHSGRRGLPPISTGTSSSARAGGSSTSPTRSTLSPVGSTAPFTSAPARRQSASRNSSVSSLTSPFSPTLPGSQQQQSGPLLSSSRLRTIGPSANSQSAASAAALPAASQGSGGTAGGGGGAAKLARGSPSLSQSSGIGSPNSLNNQPPNQQNLSKIVIAQVFLLLSSVKDEDKAKWESQSEQLRKLIDANGMEVFPKYFRRLIQCNAGRIFPESGRLSENPSTYPILVSEVQKVSRDPEQALKIAESIDTPEGDLFRDFDLPTFIDHFKLELHAKVNLALAVKLATKPDLRTKAEAIASSSFQPFLMGVADPSDTQAEIPPASLTGILELLAQDSSPNWADENRSSLAYAISVRYQKQGLVTPPEISAALQLPDLLCSHNTLVQAVHRAGPRTTEKPENCKEVLGSIEGRDVSYQQVASVLLYMVIFRSGKCYNPEIFVSALREHRAGQRLDWQDVLNSFDREGLRVTKQQFLSLYHALLPLAHENGDFDIQLLWGGVWKFTDTQLSFVVSFLSCTPDELDASEVPRLRAAFSVDQFEDASESVKSHAALCAKHPLVSIDATSTLFHMIFRSQDTYSHAQALGIPENVINANTDTFLVAASAVPKPWGPLQDQAMRQLFYPYFVKTLPTHEFVIHGLWRQDNNWLASKLLETYTSNPMSLLLILEHSHAHGWLHALITANSSLSLDLAATAHARGIFDLEPWAQQNLQAMPQIFAKAVSHFLAVKAEDETRVQREKGAPTVVGINHRTAYQLLEILDGHLSDDEMVQLQRSCLQAYARLSNYGEGHDDVIDRNGEGTNAIPKEVDERMQEHYKDMYSNESDVRDIIAALQRYKASDDPAEQDLFACMIHGLFDEYNCYGEYPLEALATTAVLFGGIINYNLLSRIALQTALAMVLESVQEYGPDDSMYKFGLQALLHFQNRLPEWPSFCDRLLRAQSLQGTEIWPKVEEVVRSQQNGDINGDPPNGLPLANGNVDELLAAESAVQPFSCIHVDPPARDDYAEEPDEDVQDKVLFVLNNISERNLREKLNDLMDALEERHHQWFANYIVEQRAKLQPNFQQLYLDMLELFDDKVLWAEVLRETYTIIIHMLNADTTMSSSTERAHLKHLGGWLGSLTIARNRPILFKNISFKDLLLEGHDTQRLPLVIPFTCKVLVQAARSTVFRPPNPWLMEIVSLLMEIYHFVDLKIQLKFEIEVMCKGIDLDHEEVEPSDHLRSRPVPGDDYLGSALPDGPEGFNDLSLMTFHRPPGSNQRFSSAAIIASLPDFSSMLVYPPAAINTPLKQILFMAAQNAIREIIAPVVERSVTIAAISASQLVAKDFATEPDETKLRDAACQVVKSLSGSLALVTCKEPLRMSITTGIRVMARDLPEQAIPEGIIIMFVNDNLDTICTFVEQAAETQSVAEIDNQIREMVRLRRIHRTDCPNEPFVDPITARFASYLPEPYRLGPGGLSREQLLIYEDFGRQVRTMAGPSHANNTSQDSGRQVPDVLQDQYPPVPNLPTPAETPALPRQAPQQQRLTGPPMQTMQTQLNGYMDPHASESRVTDLFTDLLHAAREAPEEHIKDLGVSSSTREIYESLLKTIEASPARENLALHVAYKVCQLLFLEAERRLEIEVMVQLLSSLCQVSVQTSKHVVMHLATLEDERLFNDHVTVCLLTVGLLDVRRVDMAVSKAIEQRKPGAVEFFTTLMDAMLLGNDAFAHRGDFARSFEALTFLFQDDDQQEVGQLVLSKLESPGTVQIPQSGDVHDQLSYVFDEWVHLQRANASLKSEAAFIRQLDDALYVKKDFLPFLNVCISTALDAYEQLANHGSPPDAISDLSYVHVDALAHLLVSLVTYHDTDDSKARIDYLDSVLSSLVLILVKHLQEREERFHQRVFYRLFSSIICELYQVNDDEFRRDATFVLGSSLLALGPNYFSRFAFGWLALISHRTFMPAALKMPDQVGWELYLRLIQQTLAYAGELVKPVEPVREAREFYRGVLRVLLVLHHDFPEFLAENHFRLCNSIPVHCVQLRNLVVSAYPSSFPELPDPFTAGLKVDRLEEVKKSPIIRGDVEGPIREAGIKDVVDGLLRATDQGAEPLEHVCQAVYRFDSEETGFDYAPVTVNTALIHALVLYIGTKALASADAKGPAFSPSSPPTRLLEDLAQVMRPEARYHFISSIVNQLRYPNSHTHYFSYALLHLFGTFGVDQQNIDVQHQITRVLLERLLVHRPHPWGLIITLLEILKNPMYKFWELPFIKAAPEVERLFDALFHTNQGTRSLS